MRAPLALVACAVALLAPASAHGALGWHDGDPDDVIPAAVTLNDVARTAAGEIVAVGRETVATTDADGKATTELHAAIYRLVGGAWRREAVLDASSAPVKGELLEVAVDGPAVWAVGSPRLIVRGTLPQAGAATWTTVAPPAASGDPRSVGLSAAGGWIGDDLGRLWQVKADGTLGTQPVEIGPQPAAVNGVAVAGDGSAVAVTAGDQAKARIFNVSPTAPLAAPAPAVYDAQSAAGTPREQSLVAVAQAGTAWLAADPDG